MVPNDNVNLFSVLDEHVWILRWPSLMWLTSNSTAKACRTEYRRRRHTLDDKDRCPLVSGRDDVLEHCCLPCVYHQLCICVLTYAVWGREFACRHTRQWKTGYEYLRCDTKDGTFVISRPPGEKINEAECLAEFQNERWINVISSFVYWDDFTALAHKWKYLPGFF